MWISGYIYPRIDLTKSYHYIDADVLSSYHKYLVGHRSLKDRVDFLGISSYIRTSNTFPLFWIIYWDGEAFRGYIPTKGNFFDWENGEFWGGNPLISDLFAYIKRTAWVHVEDLERDILSTLSTEVAYYDESGARRYCQVPAREDTGPGWSRIWQDKSLDFPGRILSKHSELFAGNSSSSDLYDQVYPRTQGEVISTHSSWNDPFTMSEYPEDLRFPDGTGGGLGSSVGDGFQKIEDESDADDPFYYEDID
jgi:hypothetical protein